LKFKQMIKKERFQFLILA